MKLLQWIDPTIVLTVAGGMSGRAPRDLDSDQASWVPQWHLGLQTATLGRPEHWFTTGGPGPPDIRVDLPTKSLQTKGIRFDTITWASRLIPAKDVGINDLVSDVDRVPAVDWIYKELQPRDCRYTSAEKRDIMTLCLVAGRYKARKKAEDDMDHHEFSKL